MQTKEKNVGEGKDNIEATGRVLGDRGRVSRVPGRRGEDAAARTSQERAVQRFEPFTTYSPKASGAERWIYGLPVVGIHMVCARLV